jgi:hypothetical protein
VWGRVVPDFCRELVAAGLRSRLLVEDDELLSPDPRYERGYDFAWR